MDDIGIGFGVFCGTDHVGHVAKLIADASDSHVTDIVVDRGLLHGAKVISLGQVQEVRDREVHLNLDREQFLHADGFADQRFRYPGHDWNVPSAYTSTDVLLEVELSTGSAAGYGAGEVPEDRALPPADPRPNLLRPVVTEGTPVRAADGEKVGEIASMTFHTDDGRVASVVMKWGLLGGEHLPLPLEWVQHLDDEGLTLNVAAEVVHQHTRNVAPPS
jgi:uncharacterized protein YrrD